MSKKLIVIGGLGVFLFGCQPPSGSEPATNTSPARQDSSSGTETKVESGGTTATLNAKIDDSEFFLPIYAGGVPVTHMAVRGEVSGTKTLSNGWHVDDSVQKVYDFYNAEAPKKGKVLMSSISGAGGTQSGMLSVEHEKQACLVVISADGSAGKTLVSFTQTTKPD